MSGTILTAAIVGTGVASSAAIAYAMTRRDEDVIVKLRRELEDAREQGKEVSHQAKLSIKSVRDDIRKSAAEHGKIEQSVEKRLRGVRDEAYAAIKSADRALALAQSGSSQREKIASDMATHSSSIRADLDRLAQEIRLTNISTVPLISGNAMRAMQAMSDMNRTQITDAAMQYPSPPSSTPTQYALQPGTANANMPASKPRWEDNLGRGTIGGKPYLEECYSKNRKHADAFALCKSNCEGRPECKAVNTVFKGCGGSKHKCNMFLDHPGIGSYNKDVHTALFFDGTSAPPAVQSSPAYAMPQATQPSSAPPPPSSPPPAAPPPPPEPTPRPRWEDNLARGSVGGKVYLEECYSKNKKHAQAFADCKSNCEGRPECKAVNTIFKGCGKSKHKCQMFLDHPGVGGHNKDVHTALWFDK
jgi:hypothetical protein